MNPRKHTTAGLGVSLGWLLGAAMLLVSGCGGGGSSPTESDSFIPDIANGNVSWLDSGNPSHRFSFFDVTAPGPNASFSGNEFTGNPGGPSPLTGSYSGRSISFTIQRSGGNVSYSGRFPDKDTMVLSSATAGNLTLVRTIGG
jgi:hypothetical protein